MRSLIYRSYGFTLMTVSSLILAACAVGPNFVTPTAPKVKGYTTPPLAASTQETHDARKAGVKQNFHQDRDIPGEWWALYHSPTLDALIKQGLANSPNLAAAKATLINAKENYRAAIGTDYAPSITAGLDGTRERSNSSTAGAGDNNSSLFYLYNASVNVSYTLDAFGGMRRSVEASKAQVDYERYELAAAYLTLTANIVTTAINEASLTAQINATEALIQATEENLIILEKQMKLGGASQADILSQTNILAQNRALLPPLKNSLSQAHNALAVLLGVFPADLANTTIDLNSLTLPRDLPVSLPSKLVAQRPDILASSAQLHTASANIGVATANLLPSFTLTGSYGNSSNHKSTLFDADAVVWSFGGQLLQPVFNGGALRAERRAAIAAYDQASAEYKQVVLSAFQNVGDCLQALTTDALALQAAQQAETATQQTLAMTQKQYRLGAVSYLTVLSAMEAYQQARNNDVIAEAARYSDTAALFQALGGGWWQQPLDESPAKAETKKLSTP